jgi:hypothetical protein
MERLRIERWWLGAACLGAIALFGGNVAIAISTPSSPVQTAGGAVQMDGTLAQRNRNCRRTVSDSCNRNCRRIVADRFIPFNDGAGSGNRLRDLVKGDKVELSDGTNTILGVDGRSYIGVRIPYSESSYTRIAQQSGYIPARYQDYDGVMRSTLGLCQIRALW